MVKNNICDQCKDTGRIRLIGGWANMAQGDGTMPCPCINKKVVLKEEESYLPPQPQGGWLLDD